MRNKNLWVLFLMLLAGIAIGGFMGHLADGNSWLSWLSFGQFFGLTDPLTLDLGILVITFGLSLKITMASILGMTLAVVIYRFL